MVRAFSAGRPLPEPPTAWKAPAPPLSRYPSLIPTPSRLSLPGGSFSRSQPLGEQLLDFAAALPQQPLQVQHAGPRLALVPRRVEPPALAFRLLQPQLQQPQQRQQQQLRLRRPQDGQSRPRPTLLPAQPLLDVPEPVLLPEARAEQLHQLEARQVGGAADQGEAPRIALDLGHHRLDR